MHAGKVRIAISVPQALGNPEIFFVFHNGPHVRLDNNLTQSVINSSHVLVMNDRLSP